MSEEQPDKQGCGAGDRGRPVYRIVKRRKGTPAPIEDDDGKTWGYGCK